MNNLTFSEATQQDINDLFLYLSDESSKELILTCGDLDIARNRVEAAIRDGASLAVKDGGRLLAVYGAYCPTMLSAPMLWILFTEGAKDGRAKSLHKIARRIVHGLASTYGKVRTINPKFNTTANRWLKRLGFREVEDLGDRYRMEVTYGL